MLSSAELLLSYQPYSHKTAYVLSHWVPEAMTCHEVLHII